MSLTPSEMLINTVKQCLEHETVSSNTKGAVEALMTAYREQVKASLRLEHAIHDFTKKLDGYSGQ